VNPGRWDLQLTPSPNYVALDFHGPKNEGPENGRADGWTEVLINGNGYIRWVLSNKPGAIHGVVTGAGHAPVPGAPVLLEAYDPENRKRIHELRSARADMQGRYQFFGLAPGTYRVLSTFDIETPDPAEVDTLYPKTIKVEEGRDHSLDLDMSVLR